MARTEAVLLSRQKNNHIVKYFGSFETKEYVCLVIEYCPNGDLGTFEK